MKAQKIFGAIALSTALALGTAVPAFAEADSSIKLEAEDATEVADALKDGADTTINIDTYISQISVGLPLTMPVMVDAAGGEGVAPDNYYIENNSRSNVAITDITAKILDSAQTNWSFAKAMTTDAGEAPNGTVGLGSVAFTLTPNKDKSLTVNKKVHTGPNGTGTGIEIVASSKNAMVGDIVLTDASVTELDWIIPATTTGKTNGDVTTAKMKLDVAVSSSAIAHDIDTAEDVVKVTYTVGLAAAPDATV